MDNTSLDDWLQGLDSSFLDHAVHESGVNMYVAKQLQLHFGKSLSLPLYPLLSLEPPSLYHNIPLMSYSSTLIPIMCKFNWTLPDACFDKSISTLTYVFS